MRKKDLVSAARKRMIVRTLVPWILAGGLTSAGVASAQSLSEVYGLARANDADYLAARHALDAARQRKPQAWGALLPQLSYCANFSHFDFNNIQESR